MKELFRVFFVVNAFVLLPAAAWSQTAAPNSADKADSKADEPSANVSSSGSEIDTDTSALSDSGSNDVPALSGAAPIEGQCVPACRAGFLCYHAMCVSACNPPCASGYECTDDAKCVPSNAPPPPPSAGSMTVHPYVAQMQQREQIRKERLELRMKYRKAPRFLLGMLVGVGGLTDDLDMMLSILPFVGFKMNLVDVFGIHARVGGLLGFIDLGISSTDSDGDSSSASPAGFGGFYSEAGVFFGPFGRFYFGPFGWFSMTRPFADTITYNGEEYPVPNEIDGPLGGGGMDMGIRVGKKENIDIHWRVRTTFNTTIPFSLDVGICFHFMAD